MIPEHSRLEACLSDLKQKGRPQGAKTRPMPPKKGPTWDAFLKWFATAQLGRPHLTADLWRAFSAGANVDLSALNFVQGPRLPLGAIADLAGDANGRAGMVAIYALSDSEGMIRYVGKANNPRLRFRQHKACRKRLQRPLYFWLRKEMDAGRTVGFTVLEWVSQDAWEEAEKRLIIEHRKTGRLLNVADGGAGAPPSN